MWVWGCLRDPVDVAITPWGMLLVADRRGDEVALFEPIGLPALP